MATVAALFDADFDVVVASDAVGPSARDGRLSYREQVLAAFSHGTALPLETARIVSYVREALPRAALLWLGPLAVWRTRGEASWRTMPRLLAHAAALAPPLRAARVPLVDALGMFGALPRELATPDGSHYRTRSCIRPRSPPVGARPFGVVADMSARAARWQVSRCTWTGRRRR